jgi:hypothetical protein
LRTDGRVSQFAYRASGVAAGPAPAVTKDKEEIDMNVFTAGFEPAAALLARLVSLVPGLLVPALVGLAAVLCILLVADRYVDRAIIDGVQ